MELIARYFLGVEYVDANGSGSDEKEAIIAK
jgi:hypothetical protein